MSTALVEGLILFIILTLLPESPLGSNTFALNGHMHSYSHVLT